MWDAAHSAIVLELNLLGKTRCATCSGYGHTHKACATNGKLKHFTKAGITQTIIKRAKDLRKQEISRVNLSEVAPWSCLPVAGWKRPRKMRDAVADELSAYSLT